MKINLNFSGDKNSWFDLWHYHPNDIEYSNHSSTQRSESLKKLLDTFNHFKLKLQEYPSPYQLWMLICEHDSSANAVYIHTNNPNGTQFPLKFNSSVIKDFVIQNKFDVAEYIEDNDKYYYIYEKGVGEPLHN